jgi:hypothetical protein
MNVRLFSAVLGVNRVKMVECLLENGGKQLITFKIKA